MKVLFINPPNTPFTPKSILIEPIDVLTLASYVKSGGHKVRILDMDAKRLRPENFQPKEKFDVAVIIFDYHIPLHTDAVIDDVFQIAQKAKNSGAKVFLGGKVATHLQEKILTANSPFDVLIANEMEPALTELFESKDFSDSRLEKISGIAFRSTENKIFITSQRTQKFDLNLLPIPERELVDLYDYIDVRTILSSRGCKQQCAFCHVSSFWGIWRGRTVKSVVDEIEYLVQKLRAEKILFLDDNAIADKRRMLAISEEILKRDIKITLGCLGSISFFDEAIFAKMYTAGFRWIHFGVESGDDTLLRNIHKNITREKIVSAIKFAKNLGFRVRTSWILNLPSSDSASFDKSAELIIETEPDEIRLHYLVLRLGSEYSRQFSNDSQNTNQYIHGSSPLVNLSELNNQELDKKLNELLQKLEERGYSVLRQPDEILPKINKTEKFVSLCPLRYGLNWKL